jgi:NADH-quinone oxidoreductase subunit M
MINLGITGAGLFFVASFLHTRVGPPEIPVLGGLVYTVPLLSATYLIIALAGIGLPGTNGFNGEHLVMIGAYEQNWVMGVVTGIGTILTGAYFLSFFQQAFMREGTVHQSNPLPDLNGRELTIAVSLGVMIFWIGLYTTPFLAAMNGSLEALDRHYGGTGPHEVGREVAQQNDSDASVFLGGLP